MHARLDNSPKILAFNAAWRRAGDPAGIEAAGSRRPLPFADTAR